MKKSMKNATHIEGYLYEHSLEKKVTGDTSKNPGTEYIGGVIRIATDNAIENIVDVHFTYVTPTFGSSGKKNGNWQIMEDIIAGKYKTYMEVGEEATKLDIDSAIALNEFYSDRNSQDGEMELVSTKRNEGGFIHIKKPDEELKKKEADRAAFATDMVITKFKVVEADPDREIKEHAVLGGAIFNFRKELLPVEYVVYDPKAIAYFESLGISNKNPVFTEIRGTQINSTIVRRKKEESAFGEADVVETRSSRREFMVTWAKGTPYPWDDESSITAAEMKEAMENRNTYLAGIKKRQDEYAASRKAANTATSSAADGYDF